MGKMRKVMTDPLSYVFIKWHLLWRALATALCSLYNSFLLSLKGVRCRGTVKCDGLPYFFRVPHSTISLGKGCKINSSFKSNNIGMLSRTRITANKSGARVLIGDNVGMSAATISAFEEIVIGDGTLIGGNVLITDSDWHPIAPDRREQFDEAATAPVKIGRNVFIGTRSVVLKGVTIGDNSVIGAGSVVVKDIPPNVVAGGNPCKVIRSLSQ